MTPSQRPYCVSCGGTLVMMKFGLMSKGRKLHKRDEVQFIGLSSALRHGKAN